MECPESKAHRGLRSKEVGDGYMLVCAECGADVRMAMGKAGLRRVMKQLAAMRASTGGIAMDTDTGKIIKLDKAELEKWFGGKEPVNSADILKAMDERDLVPVSGFPLPSCKKCYGVGHLGRNILTNKYVPCSCISLKAEAEPDA